MDLLFQGFFLNLFFIYLFFLFFMEDSKYLCFNGAKKKLSESNISSSLGELNATEIPLNMIEMFVVRVYFG